MVQLRVVWKTWGLDTAQVIDSELIQDLKTSIVNPKKLEEVKEWKLKSDRIQTSSRSCFVNENSLWQLY